MPQAADSLHSYQFSGAGSRIAQRIENCDAGTHQRSGFLRRQIVGQGGDGLRGHDHVLRIPAVEMKSSNLFKLAVDEVTPAAGLAFEAMPAMPAHANTLSRRPQRNAVADGIDASSDLMAGNARILNAWPSLLDQNIAMANAAGFDLDTNLIAPGLRNGTLDDLKIATGLGDLNCFHGRHG